MIIEEVDHSDDDEVGLQVPFDGDIREERMAPPPQRQRWFNNQRRRFRRRANAARRRLDEEPPSPLDTDDNEVARNWRIALGMFLIHLTLPGILSSFGVFMLYFYPNVPLMTMYSLPAFNLFISTLSAPLWRYLLLSMRNTNRLLLFFGVLSLGMVVLNYLCNGHGIMLVTYGFFAGIGTGILTTFSSGLMEYHFPTQRGVVVAFNYAASAIGCLFIPMGVHLMMEYYDFGKTSLFEGTCSMVLLTISIAVLPVWRPMPARLIGNAEAEQRHHQRNRFVTVGILLLIFQIVTGFIFASKSYKKV